MRVSSGRPSARGRKSKDIRGIGCLIDQTPEDLPRRNKKVFIAVLVPADVYQSDEAAFLAAHNRKCAGKPGSVELIVVFLAGDLPPPLPVRGRLGEPRF
jgi:hypothetical protein